MFDTAGRILLVSVEDGREVSRMDSLLKEETLHRRVKWLVDNGVNVLVCGAISRPLATITASSGIELIPWMAGDAEEILKAFLEGRLPNPRFLMPGCCAGARRFRRRWGRFRRGRGFLQEPFREFE